MVTRAKNRRYSENKGVKRVSACNFKKEVPIRPTETTKLEPASAAMKANEVRVIAIKKREYMKMRLAAEEFGASKWRKLYSPPKGTRPPQYRSSRIPQELEDSGENNEMTLRLSQEEERMPRKKMRRRCRRIMIQFNEDDDINDSAGIHRDRDTTDGSAASHVPEDEYFENVPVNFDHSGCCLTAASREAHGMFNSPVDSDQDELRSIPRADMISSVINAWRMTFQLLSNSLDTMGRTIHQFLNRTEYQRAENTQVMSRWMNNAELPFERSLWFVHGGTAIVSRRGNSYQLTTATATAATIRRLLSSLDSSTVRLAWRHLVSALRCERTALFVITHYGLFLPQTGVFITVQPCITEAGIGPPIEPPREINGDGDALAIRSQNGSLRMQNAAGVARLVTTIWTQVSVCEVFFQSFVTLHLLIAATCLALLQNPARRGVIVEHESTDVDDGVSNEGIGTIPENPSLRFSQEEQGGQRGRGATPPHWWFRGAWCSLIR